MSNVNYSYFGTTLNVEDNESLRGPPGYGFATDEFGNYDIQNNSFVNVDDIELNSVTSATSNITFNGDLDMNNNSILNINEVRITGAITENILEDTLLIHNNVTGAIERREVSSLPGTNPFDQDLNTTDSPTFANLYVNNIELDSISTTSLLPIQINEDVDITGVLRGMTELRIAGPITENTGENTLLVHNSATSAVERRAVSSLGPDLFDQELNTTDTVQFAGQTLTGNLIMGNNDITGLNDLQVDTITKTSPTGFIEFYDSVRFNGNDLISVNEFRTDTLDNNAGSFIRIDSDLKLNTVTSSNLDVNGQQILNIGFMDFQTIPTVVNTNTDFLTVDVSGNVEVRQFSSLAGDLYDQSLNIGDNVEFGNIDVDSISKAGGAGTLTIDANDTSFSDGVTNILQIDPTGIACGLDLDMGGLNIIDVGNITSQFYNTTFVNNKRAIYTKTGLAVASNTDTVLTNWTTVQSSTRVNVNPTTGVFSPVEGLYSMTYQSTITTITATNRIGARLVDDLNNTVYESVVQTSDLFQTETGKEGSQYENLVAYFDGTRTYNIHCKLNGAETMDFQIIISRLA